MKKLLPLFMGVLMCVFTVAVSAQTYSVAFPAYVPVSGGAWCEVATAQGRLCIVLPSDYRAGYFGFSGSGHNVANITGSTISGTAYAQNGFSYYENPDSVQCRFTRMNTLEVYTPYRSTSGNTSYRWESLPITAIYNTNMDFTDETGGNRQNDSFRYDTTQKVLILIFCAVVLLGVSQIFIKAWRA